MRLASAEFIGHIQAIVFLLNKRYRPYYKWTHRAMKDLPVLGAELAKKTEALTGPAEYHEKIDIIEDMCDKIIKELRAEGLSSSRSDFLLQHGAPAIALKRCRKPPESVADHYRSLDVTASACIGCKGCESRCPFGVPIASRMKKTAELFGV